MRVPGLKYLKQSTRWLRSRFIKGALILGYHRIAETSQDPYAISVNPRHFAEQLEVLHRYARPISLQELVLNLQSRNLPKRAIVLTFDDGYADTLSQAKPLLEYYQIPATVFITTGYMGREFWWNKLERILLLPQALPEKLSINVNSRSYIWTSETANSTTLKSDLTNSRMHLLQSLYQWLLSLSRLEQEVVIDYLQTWSSAPAEEQLTYTRGLTPDELTELARGNLVEIGAHTVNHPFLAKLSWDEQRAEIRESKSYLEELLGRPINSFSYPNGSLTKETRLLVQNTGFHCACASHNDVVWRSDPFNLPRFWTGNWNGERFSHWLNTWLTIH